MVQLDPWVRRTQARRRGQVAACEAQPVRRPSATGIRLRGYTGRCATHCETLGIILLYLYGYNYTGERAQAAPWDHAAIKRSDA